MCADKQSSQPTSACTDKQSCQSTVAYKHGWSSQITNVSNIDQPSKPSDLCTVEQSLSSQSANHIKQSSGSKSQKVEPHHCSIDEDESTQHAMTGPSQNSSTENLTKGDEMELQPPSQNNMFCHATEDENGKPEKKKYRLYNDVRETV